MQVGSICLPLNRMTNNQAEYFGLIAGLQAASYMGITRLAVKGDSELVIKQVCSQMCQLPAHTLLHAPMHLQATSLPSGPPLQALLPGLLARAGQACPGKGLPLHLAASSASAAFSCTCRSTAYTR